MSLSETYTEFKLTRKRFPRLKVVSYHLNEISSIDLADIQLAAQNSGVRYLLMAVDTLNRFPWVTGLKSKTSRACTGASRKKLQQIGNGTLQKTVQRSISRKKFGLIKVKKIARDFAQFCNKNGIQIYSTRSETKSAVAEGTLKSITFRYLHEHDTKRYIDQLDKFVSIIKASIV